MQRKPNLMDIMSEEYAHRLNSEEIAVQFQDESLAVYELSQQQQQQEQEYFPAAADGDEALALDLALALQLQEEEDAQFTSDFESRQRHQPKGNVTIKPLVTPLLPAIKPAAFVDEEDDLHQQIQQHQRSNNVWNRRDKSLVGQGGDTPITTKHDIELSNQRNALCLDKFVPANLCGKDMATQRLSNAAYNSLGQQVKKQQDRAMAPPTSSASAEVNGSSGKGLNQKTRRVLQNLINAQVIDQVHGILRSGKEANIYHGESDLGKEFAIKIYKMNGTYTNRIDFIIGDARYQDQTNLHRLNEEKLIHVWAEKELRNLFRLQEAGIPAPVPVRVVKNVLVMSFVGTRSMPWPQLAELRFASKRLKQECCMQCLLLMRALWQKCGLVHADLSEYNILLDDSKRCILVDVSQAVDLSHPNAREYLCRDVKNSLVFFSHHSLVDKELIDNVAKWIAAAPGEEIAEDSSWSEYAQTLGPWADMNLVSRIGALVDRLV